MGLLAEQIVNGIVLGSVYGLLGIGFTMVWNVLAFINFAHGETYLAGAYVTLLLMQLAQVPMPLAAVGGIAAGALLGMGMERIAFRPIRRAPKINLLTVAIGVSIFLENLTQLIWGASPQRLHSPLSETYLTVAGVRISGQQALVVLAAVALVAALNAFVHRTMLGKAMRAAAQDLEAAALMGIPVDRVINATFGVGSALGAAAGVLIAPLYLVYPTMGALAGLKGFTASVIGGMGSVSGAMIGGLILGIAESLAATVVSAGYQNAVTMIILFLVLLIRPRGIFGHGVPLKVEQRA